MNPDAAVVLALARGDVEAFDVARRGSYDVDRTVDLAVSHQVDSLCSWMWRHHMLGRIEHDELDRRLRTGYLYHLLRNQCLVRDIEGIQQALERRGVRGLYFKGPWLMAQGYPDPGTRPVGDIDLGVSERDYAGAVAALRDAGYAPSETIPNGAEEALRRAHYGRQLRFVARGRRPVEIHFRLVNVGPPASDEKWVQETAREIRIGECRILVPGPMPNLLQLCLHANQHAFSILRLLHDIRWALERDGALLDQKALVERVRSLRCESPAYNSLLLARDLAGAPVPEYLLRALSPLATRRLSSWWLWRLSAVRRLEATRGKMDFESTRLYLLEMGHFRDKIGFVSSVIREAGGTRGLAARAGRCIARVVRRSR